MAKSLEEVVSQIKKDCIKIIDKDVSQDLKKIESEVIKEELKKYNPRRYKRRIVGGLDDVANMNHSVKESGSIISIKVTNDTPTFYSRDYRLDEAVEEGEYYEFPLKNRNTEKYTYLKGRKFTDKTQQQINKNGDRIILKNFRKNGIKIK
ncbi:hypothetical protein [Clostridium rectalis]|uniref:hypothetical protein n=1 Tax=Clostridium rectalis TaxID=2040295 RepID=UPI000F6409C7|nr:hypothetical protein [Clostridium rectalis]